MTILLQRIAGRIRNKIEKLLSKILKEELKNPCRQTARRMIPENAFYELMNLFSLINGVL